MVTKKALMALGMICLLITAGSADVVAQIVYGQPASARAGIVFTYWKLDAGQDSSTSVSQVWFPVNAFVPLDDNLEARFFFSTTSSTLSIGTFDADAVGAGDLQLQVSKSFLEDQLLLSVGTNLPTGKTKLELTDERQIIQALSESFLDFPSRRYGEGFGFNVLAGFAQRAGSVNIGGGLMYRFAGEYTPYEGASDYDPGDVFSGNFGVNWKDEFALWSVTLGFGISGTDKSDGVNAFKQSPYVDLSVANVLTREKFQLTNQARYLLRGNNKQYAAGLEIISDRFFGNELHLSSRMEYSLSPEWFAGPLVLFRHIGANGFDFGKSYTAKLGAQLGRKFAAASRFNVDVRYLFGQANDGMIDLSGVQVSSGILLSF
jgi:hypothetical protein